MVVNNSTEEKTLNPMKKLVFRTLCVIASIFLFLFVFEIVLKTGYFNAEDNPHPIWIPHEYKLTNRMINYNNLVLRIKLGFGFSDADKKEVDDSVHRIVILGDSFIFGDGLPYYKVWSKKLEKKIQKDGNKIKVISLGYCTWSTMEQLEFMKTSGLDYDIDLLIVGFTTNDPYTGIYDQNYFSLHRKPLIQPIRKVFPNAIDFIGEYLDGVINRYSKDWGYENWENKLYSEKNLLQYQRILNEFSKFCHDNNVELLFALTAHTPEPYIEDRYNAIIPLLEKADIEYLNLYPMVVRDFSSYNVRQLWANLANPHPGEQLTELYATEVFNHLVNKRYYLKQ